MKPACHGLRGLQPLISTAENALAISLLFSQLHGHTALHFTPSVWTTESNSSVMNRALRV